MASTELRNRFADPNSGGRESANPESEAQGFANPEARGRRNTHADAETKEAYCHPHADGDAHTDPQAKETFSYTNSDRDAHANARKRRVAIAGGDRESDANRESVDNFVRPDRGL